ncbi:MAG: hypothetical protein GWM92_03890 [Gemmatimonadetes bacterium]|nr:hypothetical protein [Gemmatimonadota bacterium]NIR78498.1 hypothetical protein [Gemmatimonadota bacterium]NIT86225.1 hypothetical protein [Gemmatimonadota bacterium]NIU30050.1 hypothetical protein [Gemmatimonadota bacterium]NIU35710.1 hypothetical protein [Gemmatimonadota bacterium]
MEAVLEADLTGSSDGAAVEVLFRVRIPPGASRVPLEALRIGDGRIAGLRARVDGGPARLDWTDDGPGRSTGWIRIPQGGAGSGPLEVRLDYRVTGSRETEGPIRIPVVRVPWPPRAARPGTFTARALLPDTLRVAETFPTVLGSVTSREGGRAYALDLHVVPSVVSLRVHGASSPALSFTHMVDAGVGVLLAILGLLGWRALRRHAGGGGRKAEEGPDAAGGAE